MTDASETMQRARMRAARLSLAIGAAVFAGKFGAFFVTRSAAVFSDAMESIINIVAAGMLLLALALSARPPDRGHPYGHGKVEFFSAGIEGASILLAALLILAESFRNLIEGSELRSLDIGLAALVVCSLANLGLGLHLVRIGRVADSPAILADGRHVLTDVWTSAAVIAGLTTVFFTGWVWADPLIAIAVALNILREGASLVRDSVRGLMDEADDELLGDIVEALDKAREPAWIDVHSLRTWRSGARKHVDMHVSVPRYYDVVQLHSLHDRLEKALLRDPHGSDVVVHFDPCHPVECPTCIVEECPLRGEDFRQRPPLTLESVTRTDEEVASGAAPPELQTLNVRRH